MEDGLVLAPNAMSDIDCFVLFCFFAGLWPHEEKLDPSCVKSRTDFVICVVNCPIIWSSKLQTYIATSTMEAEYNALSMAMKELIPLKRLVQTVSSSIGLGKETITTFKTRETMLAH